MDDPIAAIEPDIDTAHLMADIEDLLARSLVIMDQRRPEALSADSDERPDAGLVGA